MDILRECRQLSSGTIATLTGSRFYEEVDGWRDDFCAYVRAYSKKRPSWASWMDAWNEFADYCQRNGVLFPNRKAS